jgi:hypothetical protein
MNISVTRGYNMAFGVLTGKLLQALYPEIVDVLISNVVPKGIESDEAESRKQAIISLVNAAGTIGVNNLAPKHKMDILNVLTEAYNDYAVDKRGDVGSWVRQEAMD